MRLGERLGDAKSCPGLDHVSLPDLGRASESDGRAAPAGSLARAFFC